MSNGPTPADHSGDADSPLRRDTALGRLSARVNGTAGLTDDRIGAVGTAAGLVALLVVVTGVTVDTLANLPFGPVPVPSAVRALVAVGTPVTLALCLVAVAVAARRATLRVGLLFVGVFGLFPLVSGAAATPALLAITLGGAVALLWTDGRPSDYKALRRRLVAAGVLIGVAVSLSSSLGILDGGARDVGGLFALGAVTAMAVEVEGDRFGLGIGGLAFALVVAASAASPYVLGSTLLVAFAVAGVPHILVACAVGGATAAAVAGLRRRDHALAVGAPLALLAGVPATFPRALTLLLGATLVLVRFGIGDETEELPTEGVGA